MTSPSLSAFDIASPDRNRLLEIDFENILKKFSNSVTSLPVPSPPAVPAVTVLPPSQASQTPNSALPAISTPPSCDDSTTSKEGKAPIVAFVEASWSLLPIPLLNLLETYFPVNSIRDKGLILTLLSLVGTTPPLSS
jgi:hypothetical protein